MLHLTIHAVCLHLLFFAYLTESFVLLTANVEDIKRIAKKFLSESLSDQISDMISKAKLQDTISDENERNAQNDRNSRERDALRPTETYAFNGKPEETFDYRPVKENYNERNPYRKERQKYKHQKRINDDRQEIKIDTYVQFEDTEKNQGTRFQVKSKNIPRMSVESSYPRHKNKKIRLTTEKQRSEFDQYDNANYDKNEMVATSGLLGLPRVKGSNNRMHQNY